MDAGAIRANKTFPLRAATKSSIFYREVAQAAIECLWEVLTYSDVSGFKPEVRKYSRPDVIGSQLPMMKQPDREIRWNQHKTDEILRRINAADGSPGVLDEIYGKPSYLYNAQPASGLIGKPGDIIAVTDHAVCRATVDGAIWIGHLKPKLESGNGIKLPAARVLQRLLPKPPQARISVRSLLPGTIQKITIDYTQPDRQLPCQEVWYEREGDVAYPYFAFHNGAMSTESAVCCYRPTSTLRPCPLIRPTNPGSIFMPSMI